MKDDRVWPVKNLVDPQVNHKDLKLDNNRDQDLRDRTLQANKDQWLLKDNNQVQIKCQIEHHLQLKIQVLEVIQDKDKICHQTSKGKVHHLKVVHHHKGTQVNVVLLLKTTYLEILIH